MVWIKDQTARSAQSDIDQCRPQKSPFSPMALKELFKAFRKYFFIPSWGISFEFHSFELVLTVLALPVKFSLFRTEKLKVFFVGIFA